MQKTLQPISALVLRRNNGSVISHIQQCSSEQIPSLAVCGRHNQDAYLVKARLVIELKSCFIYKYDSVFLNTIQK